MRREGRYRRFAAGLLAVLVMLCAEGLAQDLPGAQGVAQETPNPNAGQARGSLFRVGGYQIALPDDWELVTPTGGKPQLQFMDTDGKQGICVIFATQVGSYPNGLDADGLLAEVCKALGGDAYQVQQVGSRKVAVFDSLQGIERNITHAVFMEGMDVYVVQMLILDSGNTMRQQAVAMEVVGFFPE